MKVITKQFYQCEVCNEQYNTSGEAIKCEKRPVTKDKGVKVGDRVKVTIGEGTGESALVTQINILSKDYGHYLWRKYWHTVALIVDFDNGGTRNILFDTYETIES